MTNSDNLKFRIKLLKNNKPITISDNNIGVDNFVFFIGMDGTLYERRENFLTPVNEPYEIQRYTGLKDKNNKEIYEGDVLKIDYSWDEWLEDKEGGDPEGIIKYHENDYRLFKVIWFSGTQDINSGEYTDLYTGFGVKLIRCPSLENYYKEEKEVDYDFYNNFFGIASFYVFLNPGGSLGGLQTNFAEIVDIK